MTKQKSFRRKQLLVEKFVETPITWAREIKLVNQLASEYSIELLEFMVMGFQVPSLAYFKTKKGKETLANEQKRYDIIHDQKEKPEFNEASYERIFDKGDSLKDKLGL